MEKNSELNALKERVIKQLIDFYNGDSWVTDSMEKRIFSLSEDIAMKKEPGHTHSIAELIAHIDAWRNFVVQKLTGNNDFDIEDNSVADWPLSENWNTLQKEFDSGHKNLVNAIVSFPLERLNATVPGRHYTFLFLINGIIEHDYYHYGQIGSVLAAIKK
ncbi:MAG: DinB family protein [Ginsengibacter sp.]